MAERERGVDGPESRAAWVLLPLTLGCGSPRPASMPGPASVAVAAVQAPAAPTATLPATPPPDLSQPVGEASASDFRERLTTFYRSLGDATKRREAYRLLFAPKLTRFIGLRDVTRERALATADAFFGDKSSISYGLIGAPTVRREGVVTRVAARATGRFEVPVPKRWVDAVPELAEQSITTGLELGVELEADANGAVTSYSERDARPHRRMRVAVKTRGYEQPFVEGCWQTPNEELVSVELPLGTVLEHTGESVFVSGCGPATSVLHLRWLGRDLWVLLAMYELIPNSVGGSSTGGTTFLDWSD